MDEKIHGGMILWFFMALFIVSIFLLGKLLWPFLSIIVLAFVITGVFDPVYLYFRRRLRPSLASILTCILVFFTLFLPTVFLVGVLSKEAYSLYLIGKNQVFSEELRLWIENNDVIGNLNTVLSQFQMKITGEMLNMAISEILKWVGLYLADQARGIGANIINFVINFFLMILIVYFLLIDSRRFLSFIVDLSPLPNDQDRKLVEKFKEIAGAVLIGNGLCGLIQGLVGGSLFAIFGLKSPILWGVIMGFLAFLPIVGIGLVLIPAGLILMFDGQIGTGVFFIIFYFLLSMGIEYIFKPKLVGERIKMHTILVFLSFIGGLNLFGLLGIIYGPLVMTAFLTLTEMYKANYRKIVDPGDA
ncbi:MAG: AI-2E family transporter [Desulfobacterales bacterium]|nr:AI-2E family transporter [Desulfobacterales bacterium]